MYNKKFAFFAAFALMIAGVALTALLKEKSFYHVFYHLFLVAVIIFSLFLSMKDIFIILMLFSSAVWALGFFEIVTSVHELLAETAVIIMLALALGIYELKFKVEKNKSATILEYKKKEINEMTAKIAELNTANNNLTEEIRKYRKEFRD